MAYLYVSVYADAQQVPIGLPYQKFRVPIGAVDTLSPVIEPHPSGLNMDPYVRAVPDMDCCFERGPETPAPTTNGVDATASEFLAEGSVEYMWMRAGMVIVTHAVYP